MFGLLVAAAIGYGVILLFRVVSAVFGAVVTYIVVPFVILGVIGFCVSGVFGLDWDRPPPPPRIGLIRVVDASLSFRHLDPKFSFTLRNRGNTRIIGATLSCHIAGAGLDYVEDIEAIPLMDNIEPKSTKTFIRDADYGDDASALAMGNPSVTCKTKDITEA